MIRIIFIYSLLVLFNSNQLTAQDPYKRLQYPPGLKNAYFGVSFGYINYPFSPAHLEQNYSVESIEVPHKALRIILYGRKLTKHLSAQISYMRPTAFPRYHNVNGEGLTHNVWMTIGGLTLVADVPLAKKFSFSGEAGLGVVTRRGFHVNNIQAMNNASYASFLFGGSLRYKLGKSWNLQLNMAMTPSHKKVKQPHTIFYGAGFNYYLRPLSEEVLKKKIKDSRYFPRQTIYAGYTTNELGYGVNDFFSKSPLVIFWGGQAHVKNGFSLNYQRNIFHTRKTFAFDWGAGFGIWRTRDKKEKFFTVSVFPVLKFTVLRTKPIDLVFEYSVAGPCFISKTVIDNKQTGKRFTFQDFMGIGIYTGKKKNLYTGLRIAHFSNGNIHPNNEGVKVPLTLNLGYVLN